MTAVISTCPLASCSSPSTTTSGGGDVAPPDLPQCGNQVLEQMLWDPGGHPRETQVTLGFLLGLDLWDLMNFDLLKGPKESYCLCGNIGVFFRSQETLQVPTGPAMNYSIRPKRKKWKKTS